MNASIFHPLEIPLRAVGRVGRVALRLVAESGRMARFLMNAMLASGGYPWTVVRVEDRNAYLAALDRASIDGDIEPFAGFIAERVRWSMEQKGERNPEL